MGTHVKVLGALQIAMGAIGLSAALGLVLVFGGAAGGVNAHGDPVFQATGLAFIALVTFLAIISLPNIVIGIGLIRLRPWARIAGMVICVLSLMMIPVGTVVGIYGLWVLFKRDTERLFGPHGAVT